MARCTRKINLQVHHIVRVGGTNNISNARVLCKTCHEATPSYGVKIDNPPPRFSDATKLDALRNAGRRCECTRTVGCH